MTRIGALWLLLPEELLGIVLVAAVFAMMFGLISGRTVLGIVAFLAFLPVIPLVMEHVLGQLPPWVSLLVLLAVGVTMIRAVATLILGGRAADTMVGTLAADVVRLVVMCMFIPFRLAGRAARAAFNGFNHGD